MNKTLEELRNEIDSIDDEIMNCILKRFEIVKWIKAYKENNKMNIVDLKRKEEKKLQFMKFFEEHWFSKNIWEKIYDVLHYFSVNYQLEK